MYGNGAGIGSIILRLREGRILSDRLIGVIVSSAEAASVPPLMGAGAAVVRFASGDGPKRGMTTSAFA